MKYDNDNGLRFLSVCSGIEAASVAWGPLGWKAVAFSEIEKFPSAVLAHHYPDVPNLGDFTKIDVATLPRVDILCGGTPCQAFSVAGLRNSLDDARGNLSLEFVRLAHELADGNGLRNVVWENVPGVLNTKDNAFGCFLGGLVGADDAVPPPPGRNGKRNTKWPDSGMVSGPRGRAAWTIKDAQFFGLAQRRKRVLVIADFGNGADPAAVLLEWASVPGNPAPSREKGKDSTHATSPSLVASGRGVERTGGTRGQNPVVAVAYGGNRTSGPIDVAPAVNAHGGPHGRQDFESEAFLVHASASQQVYSIMPQNSGKDYKARPVEVAQPVMAAGQSHGNQGGDVVCVTVPVTHTLKAEGADASEDGTGRGTPIVSQAYAFQPRIARNGRGDMGDIVSALNAQSGETGKGDAAPCVAVHYAADVAPTLSRESHSPTKPSSGQQADWAVVTSAVRRLTPTECERLQGFPDGYTDIPWRGKPNSPDGPRYKALGNSWAVPKFRWLGERIQRSMPAATQVAAASTANTTTPANDNTPIKAAA